jgi:two-component system, cell cycle sensor histidine kinase and response regulator CckA
VTERRLAEERFRSTLESISLIAAGIDAQGNVTFANDFLLDLTGWTREEVIGRDWFDRFDSNPEVKADYFECMARGEIRQHFESAIRTRSGELRTIRWSSTLEHAADGRAAGIITIGEDVTEQRRSEELLREREEHFRTLIENASDVISVLSVDGTSLYESPSLERVLGWSPDELVGARNFKLRHPDDEEKVAAVVAAVFAGEEAPPLEFRLRHKDGTWRTVEAIVRLRIQRGERVIVSNYRDVTERLELQEQLLHSQKLEAVGRLAGGIAHDFNNLLTAIGGYTEFLIGGFEGDDPRREDALEIQRASERAAALTRQLLAFSRRQVLQPEVLDLGVVVADLESLLARLLGEDVELTSRVDAGCYVEADRGQLEQVITNLAVNSRDAMPEGGRLAISARRVDHEGEPHVELEVADTGTGMDPDTLTHLFEPFYTTKEKGKGTGLGLATVYGIVAQSGGDVLVESELEHGSSFRVLLPLAAAPVAQDAALAQPQLTLQGAETILLVEDEDTIRRLVRDVLGRSGYTVLDAPAGDPALELLRANEVDLLLTDVVMPGMSGPDLARIATGERPSIRVLFTSGYTNEPDELLADPDAAFIGKPFSPQSLVAKVREVLDAR